MRFSSRTLLATSEDLHLSMGTVEEYDETAKVVSTRHGDRGAVVAIVPGSRAARQDSAFNVLLRLLHTPPCRNSPRMPPSTTSASASRPDEVARILLKSLGLRVTDCRELQTLWAGYGHICALKVRDDDGKEGRYILKLIAPPPGNEEDEGHLRKMLSYEVEQRFYENIAPDLPPDVAVAKCVAFSRADDPIAEELRGVTAMVLNDLREEFPIAGGKRLFLNHSQVRAAIEWLARFHAASRTSAPRQLHDYILPPLQEVHRKRTRTGKLWLNGGYTYLATRRSELASLAKEGSEWTDAFCIPRPPDTSTMADMAAAFLTPQGRPFETLIHGDVKSENMFSTASGNRVAFFDFQYVGIGLGVCDLAKLFTCSVPLDMLTTTKRMPSRLAMDDGEQHLLQAYLGCLAQGGMSYDWDEFVRHWETALVDWCRFQASWGFWGNEKWLSARVRYILSDGGWRSWLRQELEG